MYLFPHSDNYIDVNDEQRVLGLQPSAIRFNVKNNFNFNRLFRMGVNYRRLLTENKIIKSLVTQKVDDFIENGKYGPLKAHMRAKSCLC